MGKTIKPMKARNRSRNLAIRRVGSVGLIWKTRPEIIGKVEGSHLLEAQRYTCIEAVRKQVPRQGHSNRRQNPGKEFEKQIWNNSAKLTSTVNQHSSSPGSFEKYLLRAEVKSSCLAL